MVPKCNNIALPWRVSSEDALSLDLFYSLRACANVIGHGASRYRLHMWCSFQHVLQTFEAAFTCRKEHSTYCFAFYCGLRRRGFHEMVFGFFAPSTEFFFYLTFFFFVPRFLSFQSPGRVVIHQCVSFLEQILNFPWNIAIIPWLHGSHGTKSPSETTWPFKKNFHQTHMKSVCTIRMSYARL